MFSEIEEDVGAAGVVGVVRVSCGCGRCVRTLEYVVFDFARLRNSAPGDFCAARLRFLCFSTKHDSVPPDV